MSSKSAPKPPKPTLEAETGLQSGEAHDGTDRPYLPQRRHNRLTAKEMETVLGAFFWYKYHNRPLIRDEVQGMIKSVYDEHKTIPFLDTRFENFKKHEKDINAKTPDRVRVEVDALFDSYCKNDEDAEDRRQVLMGLEVRLPPLEPGRPLKWDQKPIRTDQFYCLYCLANWCKSENVLIGVDLVEEIATKFIFRGRQTPILALSIVDNLRKPEHYLTLQLHDKMESDQGIKSHFENLVLGYFSKHAEREIPDPPKDTITSTTTAFSGLTVLAKPLEQEWSPLHDFDTESESAGPSQPPQQRTTGDPHKTAKRREREPTDSSSPESGAGPSEETMGSKGKQPVRKRPRGSGQGQKK